MLKKIDKLVQQPKTNTLQYQYNTIKLPCPARTLLSHMTPEK